MNALRHIVRGCRTLPDFGPHPGTDWLLIFVAMGGLAGAQRGGWRGALSGALFMLIFMGPLYLSGAYSRSVEQERFNERA